MNRIILFLVSVLSVLSMQAQIVASKEGDNGKSGFIDSKGNWIVSPVYYWAQWYPDGEYGTFNEESFKQKGGINKWGKVIIPCQYSDISFYKGLFYIKQRNNGIEQEGIYDIKNGRELIPPRYKSLIWDDDVSLFYVRNEEGHEGIIDKNGKVIIPCEFDDVYVCGEKYKVKKNKYEGLYDENGKSILPLNYTGIIYYNDGYFMFWNASTVGALDKNGKAILAVPNKYDDIKYAGEGIFSVRVGAVRNEKGFLTGGLWGYYADNKEIISCKYDMVSEFKAGIATVKKDGQVSLIKNPLLVENKVNIAGGETLLNRKAKFGLAVSRYPAPNSDVDKIIPVVSSSNNNLFAFVIANENYPDAPVPFALNDGRIFKKYCQKTFGIPDRNIHMFEDATYGNMIAAIKQLKEIANAYEGEAGVILYYAGHGVPDEKRNSAYLLPVDGNPSDIVSTGYSLECFYSELSKMKFKNIIIFLDACFSGAKREDEMLLSGRGVAIKVKEEAPKGNMIVFSAAAGDETAHQLEEKGHGLFTYFLLKKLQETKGQVLLGELADYVTKQVRRQSVVINNKKQTPTVIPSAVLVDKWRVMPLK